MTYNMVFKWWVEPMSTFGLTQTPSIPSHPGLVQLSQLALPCLNPLMPWMLIDNLWPSLQQEAPASSQGTATPVDSPVTEQLSALAWDNLLTLAMWDSQSKI